MMEESERHRDEERQAMYRDIVHPTRQIHQQRLAAMRQSPVRLGRRAPIRDFVGRRLIGLGQRLVADRASTRPTTFKPAV